MFCTITSDHEHENSVQCRAVEREAELPRDRPSHPTERSEPLVVTSEAKLSATSLTSALVQSNVTGRIGRPREESSLPSVVSRSLSVEHYTGGNHPAQYHMQLSTQLYVHEVKGQTRARITVIFQ